MLFFGQSGLETKRVADRERFPALVTCLVFTLSDWFIDTKVTLPSALETQL